MKPSGVTRGKLLLIVGLVGGLCWALFMPAADDVPPPAEAGEGGTAAPPSVPPAIPRRVVMPLAELIACDPFGPLRHNDGMPAAGESVASESLAAQASAGEAESGGGTESATAAAARAGAESGGRAPRVTMIYCGAGERVALVDSQQGDSRVVRPGDVVDGRRVLRIDDRGLLLETVPAASP